LGSFPQRPAAAAARCGDYRGQVADVSIVVFGDQQIPAQRLRIIDDSVSWDGDTLKVSAPTVQYRPTEVVTAIHEAREKLRRQATPGDESHHEDEPGTWTEDIPPGALERTEKIGRRNRLPKIHKATLKDGTTVYRAYSLTLSGILVVAA
jgi:hypothetical protein